MSDPDSLETKTRWNIFHAIPIQEKTGQPVVISGKVTLEQGILSEVKKYIT